MTDGPSGLENEQQPSEMIEKWQQIFAAIKQNPDVLQDYQALLPEDYQLYALSADTPPNNEIERTCLIAALLINNDIMMPSDAGETTPDAHEAIEHDENIDIDVALPSQNRQSITSFLLKNEFILSPDITVSLSNDRKEALFAPPTGNTLLALAVEQEKWDAVHLLLERGASIAKSTIIAEEGDTKTTKTLMQYVLEKGNFRTVAMLIDYDKNLTDEQLLKYLTPEVIAELLKQHQNL